MGPSRSLRVKPRILTLKNFEFESNCWCNREEQVREGQNLHVSFTSISGISVQGALT